MEFNPLSTRALLKIVVLVVSAASTSSAQEGDGGLRESPSTTTADNDSLSPAPAKVDVMPLAHDEEISQRLQRVLVATGWFIDPEVRVEEGVVFLKGGTETAELKKWAGDLARNTQDVVAVANGIEVPEPSAWNFRPAWSGLLVLWRDFIRSLPFIAFGLIILSLSVIAGVLAKRITASLLSTRIEAKLLRNVVTHGIGALVVLSGMYIVLRVSGLTQLALTVVGGTGLIGLAVGIAFRDITENFLASVFLSMQRPFETGDLVNISEVNGYVQQLNVRTTILMTLEGNVVQIPNATVYKTIIRNFTTNANRRETFSVGIGYEDSINAAQEIARNVLVEHPAVLRDPEPSVLVESLGSSTVILQVYFWLNGREHSWLKVRSSVLRLVKLAFQKHGISMPDEAREVVFPKGIPVTMLESRPEADHKPTSGRLDQQPKSLSEPPIDQESVSTKAEAGLYSEASDIKEQARHVQPLKEEENLLKRPSRATLDSSST